MFTLWPEIRGRARQPVRDIWGRGAVVIGEFPRKRPNLLVFGRILAWELARNVSLNVRAVTNPDSGGRRFEAGKDWLKYKWR